MGTAVFSIARPGRSNPNVRGRYVTGGSYTTSTTSSNLEDPSGDITARMGDILTIQGDEAMRITFGTEATPTDEVGQIIFASETADLEITSDGVIQIRDVA